MENFTDLAWFKITVGARGVVMVGITSIQGFGLAKFGIVDKKSIVCYF